MSNHQRFRKAEFAAWLGIVVNLMLAVVKGITGFLAGSKALIADAANSASDVAGSIAVLIGLKAAKLPPDQDHPYGHGKAESIAAIIVSVLLILVGFEIGLSAVKSIYFGINEAPKWFALIALIFSIVVKEIMYHYNISLGKRLNSQALIVNAHDHRSDVYASLAALIGVGGAFLGGYLEISWLVYLDPAAGILVAGLVIRTGYLLIMESIHSTMDHVLHEEDADELYKVIEKVDGVITIDVLHAREHGHYVIVDVKISVDPQISVMEGHAIGKAVKHRLMKKFDHVSDVFIHINPYDPGFPYKSEPNLDDSRASNILH